MARVTPELIFCAILSTPESMAQIKAYWEALERISNHGVDKIAQNINSGVTLATEELTQQLADVQTELNATLKSLDLELQENLLEAWTAYTEAVEKINQRAAKAIAEIDAQIQALMKTINQLLAMLAMLQGLSAPSAPTPVGPAVLGGGTGTTGAAAAYGYTDSAEYRKIRSMERGDIIINANTNASPQQIANEVGWVIRTSGDVQYANKGGR